MIAPTMDPMIPDVPISNLCGEKSRLPSKLPTIAPAPIVSRPSPVHVAQKGSRLLNLLRTTDHKTIGLMYLTTAFAWFMVGGLMAMLMRGELARPGLQYLSQEQYNQLFTMHGT